MKLIERPRYLERLKRLIGTSDIKVITGVRRAGKSKLLEAFRNYLLGEVDGANVIHVDLSLLAFNGVHPKVMQALAGHASSKITMDIYTHVNIDAKRSALAAVSSVF